LSRRRSVFCEVGTEVLYIVLVKLRLHIFKAKPWLTRSVTVEAWVRIQVRPYEICGGQSGSRTQFDPSTSVSPLQYNSTKVRCSPSTTHCCYQSERREKPKNLQKAINFVNRGALDTKIHSSIFRLQVVR